MQNDSDRITYAALADDMVITRTTRRAAGAGTWVIGTIAGHKFNALVFAEHATDESFELDDSRISKLWIARLSDGAEVCAFDRGWCLRPTTETAAMIADFLAAGLAESTYGE